MNKHTALREKNHGFKIYERKILKTCVLPTIWPDFKDEKCDWAPPLLPGRTMRTAFISHK